MALQEEYEYSPFRCAFCGAYNPAKKQRPQAPKLPFEIAQLEKMKEQHGSSSSLAESEGSSSEESPSVEGEAESPEQEQATALDQDDEQPQEDDKPEADMATLLPNDPTDEVDPPQDLKHGMPEQSQVGTKAD